MNGKEHTGNNEDLGRAVKADAMEDLGQFTNKGDREAGIGQQLIPLRRQPVGNEKEKR